MANGNWNPDNEQLKFNSNDLGNHNDNLGCRLAGSLLFLFFVSCKFYPSADHFSSFLKDILRGFVFGEIKHSGVQSQAKNYFQDIIFRGKDEQTIFFEGVRELIEIMRFKKQAQKTGFYFFSQSVAFFFGKSFYPAVRSAIKFIIFFCNRQIFKQIMRVFHNIYNDLISFKNLYKAWLDFRSGKTRKKSVIIFEHNLESNLFKLKEELENFSYRHGEYEKFIVRDPKERIIHKADVRDRVVHTLVAKKLEEIYQGSFIFHSFACQKNKGTHWALEFLKKMCRKRGLNYTRNFWYLKCDIKKFFDNVNHDVLLKILGKKIKDEKFIWLIEKILESFHKDKIGIGLPLGNFTSQWLANIYLNELDYFIKDKLGVKNYIRYADDFVILGEKKEDLEILLVEIEFFLRNKLKLNLHPDKVILKKFSSGIEWVGYKIFPHHAILKKETKNRMFQKINEKEKELATGRIGLWEYYQTVASYLGQLSHSAGYKTANQIIFKNI